MAGEPKANFLKIILLLMKYGSKVLQQKIEYELRVQKWQRVTQFVDERKHDILHLTLDKCKRCCIQDCQIPNAKKCLIHYSLLKLMYKDVKKSCSTKFINCCSCNLVPRTDLDINDWDITLTSCLLLRIIGFKDAGQKQVIQNLRDLRSSNELLHRGNAEMQDDEFEQMWIRLSNDIKEVAEKCEPYFYSSICKEVDRLKDNPLEQGERYKAEECWKKLKRTKENAIQSLVNLLTSSKSELKRDIEVENIYGERCGPLASCLLYSGYSKSCLEDHTKKIGMYVAPNRAINHSLKALEKHRLIIITGEAGSGKTRFGLELMSRMKKEHQNLIALILTECSQWNKLDFEKEYIFFIDDLLGKSNANDVAFQGWSMAFDSMHKKLTNNHVIIIFALRNGIWHLMKDRLADYTLFRLLNSSNPPVDLSGVEFGMTSQEKLGMLNRFCRYNNVIVCNTPCEEEMSCECSNNGPLCLSKESLRVIANMDTTRGFPFLCEEFFSDRKFLKQGSSFFHTHSACSYVKGQVDEFLSQEKYLHYAILVFFFIKDYVIETCRMEEIWKSKIEIENIAKMVGDISSRKLIKAIVHSCLANMLTTFISSSDNGYKLRHMVVYEAILLSFGENFPVEFLELISKTVLFTYVRSNGYVAGKQEVIVRLDAEMTELLAKKLIDVYGPNKEEAFSDVYKHPAFHDKKLVGCFLDILEGEESFIVFLNSFVAGACKERKDILASEVIRRFVSFYQFERDVLDLVLNYDLINTFREYMNDLSLKKTFFKFLIEEGFAHVISKAVLFGARQCVMLMLDFLNTEDDLETDGEMQSVTCVKKINYIFCILDLLIIHHNQAFGNDWSDALIKLGDLCPCEKDRNIFYRTVMATSIGNGKLDIAFKVLEKIDTFTHEEIRTLMRFIFVENKIDLFYTLYTKMKNVHFKLNSCKAANMIIECVKCSGNEDMFNVFLNEFPCDFNNCTYLGSTILHACEAQNFSDSTLLRILQRPEGKSMFTSVDGCRRVPVQCRASYTKIRRLNNVFPSGRSPKHFYRCYSSKLNRLLWVNRKEDTQVSKLHHVHNVHWRDDTLVVYSSLRNGPILLGFSKLECGPRCKDW